MRKLWHSTVHFGDFSPNKRQNIEWLVWPVLRSCWPCAATFHWQLSAVILPAVWITLFHHRRRHRRHQHAWLFICGVFLGRVIERKWSMFITRTCRIFCRLMPIVELFTIVVRHSKCVVCNPVLCIAIIYDNRPCWSIKQFFNGFETVLFFNPNVSSPADWGKNIHILVIDYFPDWAFTSF